MVHNRQKTLMQAKKLVLFVQVIISIEIVNHKPT